MGYNVSPPTLCPSELEIQTVKIHDKSRGPNLMLLWVQLDNVSYSVLLWAHKEVTDALTFDLTDNYWKAITDVPPMLKSLLYVYSTAVCIKKTYCKNL